MCSKLIVSCQAEPGNPFNDINSVVKFALSAKIGGAGGIRSEGVSRTKKIINEVGLPTIGLIKRKFQDGFVGITIRESDVVDLIEIGSAIIAIDGTNRIREGISGCEFISKIKKKYNCKIMADVSTFEEGVQCEENGADFISTTLNGYTPWTISDNNGSPNFKLISQLVEKIKKPVVAEGRIANPLQALELINIGCSHVVVGSFITRPHLITKAFVELLN
jgi:N-acylglucosamine-6-phosphate 2-epimerase